MTESVSWMCHHISIFLHSGNLGKNSFPPDHKLLFVETGFASASIAFKLPAPRHVYFDLYSLIGDWVVAMGTHVFSAQNFVNLEI